MRKEILNHTGTVKKVTQTGGRQFLLVVTNSGDDKKDKQFVLNNVSQFQATAYKEKEVSVSYLQGSDRICGLRLTK